MLGGIVQNVERENILCSGKRKVNLDVFVHVMGGN